MGENVDEGSYNDKFDWFVRFADNFNVIVLMSDPAYPNVQVKDNLHFQHHVT